MAAAFQEFQRELAVHLRDPRRVPRPEGTSARRVGVYRELVFNNLCGFVDACFPVCRSLLGDARWRRLCRGFLRDWPLHTPWFREVPREFVRYLNEGGVTQPLPRWLAELAHYEWAELAVDVMAPQPPAFAAPGDLLDAPVVVNPALMNLAYAWPVHRIGPAYRPRRPQATHLVVYRDTDERVRFSEVMPLTARLIDLLVSESLSGRQAIQRLAGELNHPNPGQLLGFGAELLADLQRHVWPLWSHP